MALLRWLRSNRLGWAAFLLVTASLIIYPLGMLIAASFSDAPLGESGNFTLANYSSLLSPSFGVVLLHTLWVAVMSTVFAATFGFGMAWLVVRSDLPFARVAHVFAMLPFLIPGALSAIGWAVLANPDIGVLNTVWSSLTGAATPLLNIYSYEGIAFVLGMHSAGFVYLMMVAPLKNMDPSFIEAARLSGANMKQIFRFIELPLLWSALLPLFIFIFARAIETFEVPAILGTPANVFLVTNAIYYKLKVASPPESGSAIALSMLIGTVLELILIVQFVLTSRRSRVTLTGKGFREDRVKLGALKPLCVALVVVYAAVTSILPLGLILFSSFFSIFGIYDASTLTTANYAILTDPLVRHALANTILLTFVCSTAAILIGAFVAYALHHRLVPGKAFLEIVMFTPWAMPGLVFGIAMLWAYIQVPGLYGTVKVMALAYITLGIAIGVRSMRAVFEQLSKDLEESALVHGANLLQVLRHIVFPLVRPGLIAGWFVLATLFSRELAASVMLYGSGSEVISVLILGFWEQGRGNYVTVLSIVIMLILMFLYGLEAVIAWWLKRPVPTAIAIIPGAAV